MSEFKLTIPSRLTLVSTVEDLKIDSIDLPDCGKCILDFSGVSYGEPLPLMLLAVKLKKLVRSFLSVQFLVRTKNSSFRGYADHIGYFRFIGFDRGNPPGFASGSNSYVPIEIFDIEAIRREAGNQPVGPLVAKQAGRLASVLSQADTGALFDLFEYSLREIMRNSVEHSLGRFLVVQGQYWGALSTAEIVVMDNGIGVAENIYENEYVDCSNNREALKFSLLPGVSGVSREDRIKQDETWGNSGFGLYVTSRFCSEDGSFRILSGSGALTLSRGVQTEHDWGFKGTCVQMRINTKNAHQRVARISQIISEGETEWGTLVRDFPIKASVASKMIGSHFLKEHA